MAEKIGQGLDWLEVLKLLGPNWGSTERAGTPLTSEEMSTMQAKNPGLVFLPANGEAESMEQLLAELQLAAEEAEEEAYDARVAKAEKQGLDLLKKIQGGKPKYEESDLFTGLPEDNRGFFEMISDLFGGKEAVSNGKDAKAIGKQVVTALNPLAEIPSIESNVLTRSPLGTKEKAKGFLKNLYFGALGVGAGTEAAANAAAAPIVQKILERFQEEDLQKQQEAQVQKIQDALAALGPKTETALSEHKGSKVIPGEKPEAEDKSGYDWSALLTAIGSGIGNWSFDPRTGSLTRTDSNGPNIFEILKAKEDIRASKQKSQQPMALGGSAYYDPRTGKVVQTESDVMKVVRLQAQMAQDEEKRKNTALAAQLLASLEPRERMKLMSEAMLAGKDKLDTNAYIIQRIQNAQNAKRK